MKLYYEEHGNGFPLILIHGFPLDHTIWSRLIPFLETKARVILPDLRGHGLSPVTGGVYAMQMMAGDILNMMDVLKIERALIAGHSMGGYVTLSLAHSCPDRIAGIALVATQALADTPERRQNRYLTADEVALNGMKNLAESMALKLSTKPELKKYLVDLLLRAHPTGVIGALKGMAERPDATEWLADIKSPVMVLYGEKDNLIPPEKSKAMLPHLRYALPVEVAGAEHMPMLEAPRAVADAFLRLLSLTRKV